MSKLGITLEDLFNLSTAVIYNPDVYRTSKYVSIDSRKIKKNSIYVAIKGERFDGHNFVKDAVKKGAETIIINKNKLKDFDSVNKTIVTVEDTVKAYGELATERRRNLGAAIISLTGSAGKTTTKEMLAVLLREKYRVFKTEANNNNHIGVPLTLLSAPGNTETVVLEHGTNHFNEIKYTADIAEPDYALITNIGDSHLEFLKNRDGVLKEKSALLDAAVNNHGKVFINTDDPVLKRESKKYSDKITFGFKDKADVKGKILGYTAYGHTIIKVEYKTKTIETVLPVMGEAAAKNFLAACAVCFSLKLTKRDIMRGAAKIKSVKGRLQPINRKDMLIIDDTYNSSPDSMKNAVLLLKKISKFKRKILIAGDMFELGRNGKKLHENLSEELIKNKITDLYTTGKLMKNLSAKVSNKINNVKHFQTRNALSYFLMKEDLRNSVILVKGSRGMKMEEFLQTIIDKD